MLYGGNASRVLFQLKNVARSNNIPTLDTSHRHNRASYALAPRYKTSILDKKFEESPKVKDMPILLREPSPR